MGLDVQASRTVQEWITQLTKERGKTVVLTTHQLDMAENLCDRVAIMSRGRLLAHRPTTELLDLFRQEFYQIRLRGSIRPADLKMLPGFNARQENGHTVLAGAVSADLSVFDLVDWARRAGLDLISVTPAEPNLEEISSSLSNGRSRPPRRTLRANRTQVTVVPSAKSEADNMRMTGTVLLNECYKRIILLWSYRFNFLTDTFMIGFLFIGISFFVSGGSPAPEQMAPALLGYLTWFFAAFAIGDMSQGIRDETQTGTLEQMYMSPLPSGLLLAGRSVASLLVSSAMVILVGGILMLILGIRIPVRLEGVPIFALTMTGLYGFAFCWAGQPWSSNR